MVEQQWRTVATEDLREMTPAERKRCRVRIGDVTRDVFDVGENERIVYTVHGGLVRDWYEDDLSHWGAVYEAPAPPPRPLPTHEDAVILVGDEMLFQSSRVGWFKASDSVRYSRSEVQDSADKYGWVELVPADGPDAEDRRSAAIREVHECLSNYGWIFPVELVRKQFPEAFSDAVNAKEMSE